MHYLRREFSYSKYDQTLILPDDVDKNNISAKVEHGVMTVALPKIKKEGRHDIIMFSKWTLSHDLVGDTEVGDASFAEYIKEYFGGK